VTSLEQYLDLKEKGYKFEGQSYLFWEYIRLLKEIKPKWFLLENVKMAKKWKNIITNSLNIEPIEIDSALFSAQYRKRLYWTNIPIKTLPNENNLKIKDILQPEETIENKYYWKRDYIIENINNRIIGYVKQGNPNSFKYAKRIFNINYKAPTLTTCDTCCRIYINNKVRKLTPLEWERLQTLPDNYTKYGIFENKNIKIISDTQRYKIIGNGWTVKVIEYIFKNLK